MLSAGMSKSPSGLHHTPKTPKPASSRLSFQNEIHRVQGKPEGEILPGARAADFLDGVARGIEQGRLREAWVPHHQPDLGVHDPPGWGPAPEDLEALQGRLAILARELGRAGPPAGRAGRGPD